MVTFLNLRGTSRPSVGSLTDRVLKMSRKLAKPPFWAFWAFLGLFGPFWAFLGLFGLFWAFLGLFGGFWAFFRQIGTGMIPPLE